MVGCKKIIIYHLFSPNIILSLVLVSTTSQMITGDLKLLSLKKQRNEIFSILCLYPQNPSSANKCSQTVSPYEDKYNITSKVPYQLLRYLTTGYYVTKYCICTITHSCKRHRRWHPVTILWCGHCRCTISKGNTVDVTLPI